MLVQDAFLIKGGIKNLSGVQLHRCLITKKIIYMYPCYLNLSKSIPSVSSYACVHTAYTELPMAS